MKNNQFATYRQWIKIVDAIIARRLEGLRAEDISVDGESYTLYESGDTPQKAAKSLIQDMGDPFNSVFQ